MNNWFALVVEDDPHTAAIFGKALEAVGFRVEIAQTASEALACLANAAPDVVSLDLHLPEGSGEHVLRYVRSDARLANTRVIVTTADAARAATLHDKADIVLVKPVSFAQLRDLAARLRLTA